MDALQDLISEIHRIQCLVCALRRDGGRGRATLPLPELREQLRMSPDDCGRVVTTLAAEGLFETVAVPPDPHPTAVRLTERGRRYVEQWSASLSAPGRAAPRD